MLVTAGVETHVFGLGQVGDNRARPAGRFRGIRSPALGRMNSLTSVRLRRRAANHVPEQLIGLRQRKATERIVRIIDF